MKTATREKPMSLTERVKELDRLYLACDRARLAAYEADDPKDKKRFRRSMQRYYRLYCALRDPRKGL